MDIEKAYEVLNKYYTKNDLNSLYKSQKFDGSGTDTIKKHKYNADLLEDKAREIKDEVEKQELLSAEKAFRDLLEEEWWNR